MRLLDRYLLRELLVPLGYCLAGFLIFWISFDLFSELDNFREHHSTLRDIVDYYVVKTPELLVTVLPIALLLALLYALTNHARHQELTAIRAAGVSLWRLSAPYFAVALVFSAAVLWLNERWVPLGADEASRILNRHVPRPAATEPGRWSDRLDFRNSRDDRTWNIGAFELDTHQMRSPQVEWNLPDGSSWRLLARSAVWSNGVWIFRDAQLVTYTNVVVREEQGLRTNIVSEVKPMPELAAPEFSETPEQIASEIKLSRLRQRLKPSRKLQQISIQEILGYLRLHPDLNRGDRAWLQTQLQAHLAAPWTCLVVALIAIPFGAPSGRRNLFVGVAGSIFICFGFFVLTKFGFALGTGGLVPPWLAAWMPNILFGAAGLGLMLRVR